MDTEKRKRTRKLGCSGWETPTCEHGRTFHNCTILIFFLSTIRCSHAILGMSIPFNFCLMMVVRYMLLRETSPKNHISIYCLCLSHYVFTLPSQTLVCLHWTGGRARFFLTKKSRSIITAIFFDVQSGWSSTQLLLATAIAVPSQLTKTLIENGKRQTKMG